MTSSPPGDHHERRASDSLLMANSPAPVQPAGRDSAQHNAEMSENGRVDTSHSPVSSSYQEPLASSSNAASSIPTVMEPVDDRQRQQAAHTAHQQQVRPQPSRQQPIHPHMVPAQMYPADVAAYGMPGGMAPSAMEQMRYGEQPYASLRPVYAPQMYYDPAIAAAAAVDYNVDPAVYAPRTSPGSAYSSQPSVPGQFHPSATTPPVPQAAWTGAPMGQTTFYGSYPGMQALGPQQTGPGAMSDEARTMYLGHSAPPSAWTASPVLSAPYQFFSPYPSTSDRMENPPSVGERWSPPPQSRQLRPSFAGPPPAASAQWSANAAGGRDRRRSVNSPEADKAQHHPDRERKEYHPQPPSRRSEWVMWVGNVPSNVSHEELWRFFNTTTPPTAEADWKGPSSIFLISRSSCAFVNFSSQADLDTAVPFFHGLSLRPWDPRCPRMVCRVRHRDDDLRAGVGGQRGVGMHRSWVEQHKGERQNSAISPRNTALDLPEAESRRDSGSGPKSSASFASTNSSFLAHHFPKRYFILKSLTITDLEESVKHGTWKTQRHNQPILDQAFRTSQEVFLIFGANRSGEFFGYARMVSPSVRVTKPSLRTSLGSVSFGVQMPTPTSPTRVEHLRTNRPQLSQPTPIREEGPQPPRSVTDPYTRRASTAFLAPGERAASPGAIDEEDEFGLSQLEIEERIKLMRSESPDALEESMRRVSVNTLDPNLLRKQSTMPMRVTNLEPSNSLQVPIPGRRETRKETLDVPKAPRNATGDFAVGAASGLRKETTDVVQRQESAVYPERQESVAVPGDAHDSPSDPLAPPFQVQWVKIAPLSFFRTRHLRNPWNGDREVKVSRDGTEVEPNVGAQLLAEWDALETKSDE